MEILSHGEEVLDWGDLAAFVDRGQHYRNAPIIEAIVEIQVESTTEDVLEKLSHFLDDYSVEVEAGPSATPIFSETLEITDQGLAGERTQIGHLFQPANSARVIQARTDRMIFARGGLYDEWPSLRSEAREVWNRYRQAIQPDLVSRLAVRFVNRIDVPKQAFEVKDYLRTSIELSPYLPQTMSGFFARTELPLPAPGLRTIITTATVEPPRPEVSSIVLDIEAFSVRAIDLSAPTADDTIWRELDLLRDAKNFVFESCITDATRGLIS